MWTRFVACCSRLGFAWARRRLDDEARREFETHLALLTERYIRSGMTPEEAHTAARRQFGNVTIARERIYQMNTIGWIESVGQDVRYAIRQLRHAPGFALVVVATLALGIGGTTAVFSVVEAVLLAPLPYEQPGQLVRVYMQEPGNPTTRKGGVSATHFRVLRDSSATFGEIAGLITRGNPVALDLFRDGQAQRLRMLHVTSDYFRALRAEPFRGPGFTPDDEVGLSEREAERAGRDDRVGRRRVVLSDALWRSRFNGDPAVIGTTIHLSGEPYEIAGIAAPGLKDPIAGEIDAWLPYNLADDTFSQNYSLTIVGRMRNGVHIEQAQAELDVLSESMKKRWPDVRASNIVAVPLKADLVTPTSRGLLQLLLIAVGLVLLVACVNVANLLLVRATSRVREFAIRSALGSGRRRLARQLLAESLVLAGLGGLLGLAVAQFGVRVLRTLGHDALPRLDAVAFNPTVLGFALLVTLSVALASGVMPVFRLARIDPGHALLHQSRSATSGRRYGRLRSGLAAAQIAFALALLVGAGVLLASFYRLQQVGLGFRVDRVLTFELNLPSVRYDAASRARFQEELSRRIEAIPGVIAAGGTSRLPATGSFHTWPLVIESGPLAGARVKQPEQPEHRTVSGRYFAALGIPLLAGRTFDDRDDADAPARAVVSANFARIAFPGMPLDSVVGQRIRVFPRYKREIIGVVGDVTLDVYGTAAGYVYSAHRQFADNRNWALMHVVATEFPPGRILGTLRAEVARLDPQLVVYRVAPMSEVVGRGSGRERFALALMGIFAAVSVTLAAIGLYGVLTYMVRERTSEIGIRIALGASAAQIRALVLRQAALVLGIGIVAGIAGALMLGRWLASLLFQTSPWDPRILAATSLLLTLTGLFAAWLPARRAARLEPRTAILEG